MSSPVRRRIFTPLLGDAESDTQTNCGTCTHIPQSTIHAITLFSTNSQPINFNMQAENYVIDSLNFNQNNIQASQAKDAKAYVYTKDLILLDKCTEIAPEILPPCALKITTPLVAAEWEALLKDHPDRQLVQYIVTGVREGFRIGANVQRVTCTQRSCTHSQFQNFYTQNYKQVE